MGHIFQTMLILMNGGPDCATLRIVTLVRTFCKGFKPQLALCAAVLLYAG